MRRLAQATAYTVMLKLFLSSDHVSVATGKTVAIKISKNGGAFANPNAGATNATEVSDGWYKVTLDATDTGTLGDLVVRGTATGCDDAEQVCQVVSATTGGATNLDAAVSAVKAKTDSLTFTVAGMVDSNVVDWKGSAAPAMTGDAYARLGAPAGASVSADVAAIKTDTGTLTTRLTSTRAGLLDHLDADVSSRMATFSYTAPDNAGITAIKAKTDNLPSDPADQSLIIAATDSLSGQISGLNNLSQADIRNAVGLASANLDTQIAALATAAGLSDLSDGISASFTSLQGHGDGAWATATGFSTYDGSDTAGTTTLLGRLTATRADNLDKLDAAVTSRLAAADYTAPDDTAVLAAIAGLNDLSAAEVNAEVDAAIADAALATAESLATTDGKVDAVKGKTDQLGFSGSLVNANIAAVNGTQVQGDGTTGNEWGPA